MPTGKNVFWTELDFVCVRVCTWYVHSQFCCFVLLLFCNTIVFCITIVFLLSLSSSVIINVSFLFLEWLVILNVREYLYWHAHMHDE